MAKKDPSQKKKRPRSIRNRRWAIIIAAILALGMALSTVGLYLGYITGRDQAAPHQDWDPEAFMEQYRYNAEQLEAYIEEHGPNVAVLESLAENYYYLIMFQQMIPEYADGLVEYQDKLLGVYESLLELEPGEPRYHMELLYVYQSLEKDEPAILAQVARLQELLQEFPDPRVSLSLIEFLESIGQGELVETEAARARAYLEELLAEETADNHDRYLYAVLLAEYQDDKGAALEQLDLILASEPEESDLYSYVQDYRSRLAADEDPADAVEEE